MDAMALCESVKFRGGEERGDEIISGEFSGVGLGYIFESLEGIRGDV